MGLGYLKFTGKGMTFQITITDNTVQQIEYSWDNTNWSSFDFSFNLTQSIQQYTDSMISLYIRGKGGENLTSSIARIKVQPYHPSSSVDNNTISVEGNVLALVDYERDDDPTLNLGTNCFSYMFVDNSFLGNIPSLSPATIIPSHCYTGMFSNCIGLTTVDFNNSATVQIGSEAYSSMFNGCTNLITVNTITDGQKVNNTIQIGKTNTILGSSSCAGMFSNCKKLVSNIILPIINLGSGCYSTMFWGCNSITSLPNLPATTLTPNCYSQMFYNCTSLNNLNSATMPAITISYHSYYQMFWGCSSLVTPPITGIITNINSASCYQMFLGCISLTKGIKISVTTYGSGVEDCFNNMFYGCRSLTDVTDIQILAVAGYQCCTGMFNGCSSLTTVPNNMLPATSLSDRCYMNMFANCSSLTNIPNLPASNIQTYSYYAMFSNCTSLTTIDNKIGKLRTFAEYSCSRMFYGCTTLRRVPNNLFSHLSRIDNNSCSYMFSHSGLIEMPEMQSFGGSYSYSYMFSDCPNLTATKSLPARDLYGVNGVYYHMFSNCTNLTYVAPIALEYIYDTNTNLMEQMFSGCISLTTPPKMFITKDDANGTCLNRMFYGCINIKISETKTDEYKKQYRIPAEGTGTATSLNNNNMFENTGGTFTGTPQIYKTYYLYGEDPTNFNIYVGVNGKAKKVEKIYVGVNGKAKEVTAMYVGVNGKAKQV